MGQPGFVDLGERYRGLDAKRDPLVVLNAVVPWEEFRARLGAVWRKPEEERKTAAGRKPWDEVIMSRRWFCRRSTTSLTIRSRVDSSGRRNTAYVSCSE